MTFYLGLVDRAEDGSWGVRFPDLRGCYSSGTDMDDLFTRSIEAVRLWVEDAIADDEEIPQPRDFAALMRDREVADEIKAAQPFGCLLQVPLLIDAGRSVRANISIDAALLEAIDAAAQQRKLTRSAFLASAARTKIERGE